MALCAVAVFLCCVIGETSEFPVTCYVGGRDIHIRHKRFLPRKIGAE